MSYLHFVNNQSSREIADSAFSALKVRDWFALIGVSIASFMAILDIQVTNASLREIQGALSLELTEGGWISTVYLIAETIMIPITAYLTEVFGMRKLILLSSVLFLVSSMLCGLAWDLPSMIVFRAFQGIAGGALIPLAFQVLLVVIPAEGRSIGMVMFGLTATLAPTVGPSLGGWLTDEFGWRYIFYLNLIPGLVMMGFLYFGMEKTKAKWSLLRQFDFWGVLTLAAALGSMTFLLEEGAKHNWFESFEIQVAFLLMLLFFLWFLFAQIRREKPLLDLSLFLQRNFFITCMITFISGATLFGGIYSLSIYLGQIQKYSSSQIGQVIMWLGVPQLLVMPLMPWLMRRVNLKLLTVIGLFLFAISNYMNSHMDFNYAGTQVRLSLLVRAIGQPLFMIPISTIGMALVTAQSAAQASSLFNMMRNIGGSVGVAIGGTFLVSNQSVHFQEIVRNLQSGQVVLNEALLKIEYGMRSAGAGIEEAKKIALQGIVSQALRDSYIEAFNDIFLILSLLLVLAILLVGFLKKTNWNETAAELHG